MLSGFDIHASGTMIDCKTALNIVVVLQDRRVINYTSFTDQEPSYLNKD